MNYIVYVVYCRNEVKDEPVYLTMCENAALEFVENANTRELNFYEYGGARFEYYYKRFDVDSTEQVLYTL